MEAVQQVAAAQDGDILVEGLVVPWFGDQEEREACRTQLLDERLLGVKTVGDDNCGHTRIVTAKPLQHPVAGRDFAILLAVLAAFAVTVADEFGSEGEHLAFVGMDDGGLQDVMMIVGDAGLGGGQAVLAFDQFGVEEARAIKGDQIAGVEDLEVLEPFEALQATDPVGESGQEGLKAMAVDQIAQLGVDGDLVDAEGRGQVVGLKFALEAALELEQGTVLDEKQSEATEVTVAQGVADFAELASVDDTGYAVGDGGDEGRETK